MAKYFLTHKAVDDLSKIWEYTYEVWSENQADKYYQLGTRLTPPAEGGAAD